MKNACPTMEAVKHYCSESSVDYAILINGDWGTGKTFTMKNFLYANYKKQYTYISLFGLSSIKDIEEEIVRSFVSFSSGSTDVLKDAINSLKFPSEAYSVGGVGLIVKSLLEFDKSRQLKKSRTRILCFDDLERWNGDIDICLSYISKLVEHSGTKCIVICALDKLSCDEHSKSLQKAKQKSIRHTYKMELSFDYIINNVIKEHIDDKYRDNLSLKMILKYKDKNVKEILIGAKSANIRNIFTSIKLYDYVYRHNKDLFDEFPENSYLYFQTILCFILLLNSTSLPSSTIAYFNDTDDLQYYSLLKEFKFFEKEKSPLTKEQRFLLQNALYSTRDIHLSSLRDLINLGYYSEESYSSAFDAWQKSTNLDIYLDYFKHWYCDDEEALSVLSGAFKSMFLKLEIDTPNMILAFSEKACSDIERGVINLKIGELKLKMHKYIDFLNSIGVLKTENREIGWRINKYERCECIYNKLVEINDQKIESEKKELKQSFWEDLANGTSIDDDKISSKVYEDIFNFSSPENILCSLEKMDNINLFELARCIGSRYSDYNSVCKLDIDNATKLSKLIDENYSDKYSVSASHLKSISKMIKGFEH
ncbi:P-loop NTPase family protein [Vibrio parahaemolyticus]|uniref:hypothetical protein n=1 Tax=Vibrio parahaemolyticus TaxID=670 RepID=UPI0011CB8A4D|nr:hypothetical protein [Vibrio parahaemolyticus]TXM15471.1 hypothetical protein FVP09_04000 [Vibrio parahaemolyticus]